MAQRTVRARRKCLGHHGRTPDGAAEVLILLKLVKIMVCGRMECTPGGGANKCRYCDNAYRDDCSHTSSPSFKPQRLKRNADILRLVEKRRAWSVTTTLRLRFHDSRFS